MTQKNMSNAAHECGEKHVISNVILRSCCEKGYAVCQYHQQHYYRITDAGADFMRSWLGLPEGVMPTTFINPGGVNYIRTARGRRFATPEADRESYVPMNRTSSNN